MHTTAKKKPRLQTHTIQWNFCDNDFFCLMAIGRGSAHTGPVSEDLNQTSTLPSHNDVAEEDTSTGTGSGDTGPVSEDLNQTLTLPSHNDVAEEDTNTSQSANDTTFPQMDRMADEVRWRGPAESTPYADSQSSIPEDYVSIRVKFNENERLISVNRTITVGELKR